MRIHHAIGTICLGAAGILTMILYTVCNTSCSYLKGDLFGVDLKYIGIGYMVVIISFALFKQAAYVRMLLAAGIGVEIYLVVI